MSRFSDDEIRRYSRQILLREVGGLGQERLRDGAVRLLGSGLLAETAARYLLRAGIGRVILSGPDEATADDLRLRLADEAELPCGPPLPVFGRPGWADPAVVRLLEPGVTVLRVEPAASGSGRVTGPLFLWAASGGMLGEVGSGCPCASRLDLKSVVGPAAFGAGAALALEAVKLLLGLPDPFKTQHAGRRVFCLAQGPGQQPLWREEPLCRCPVRRSDCQPPPA